MLTYTNALHIRSHLLDIYIQRHMDIDRSAHFHIVTDTKQILKEILKMAYRHTFNDTFTESQALDTEIGK